jgi:hypothetical protein
MISGNLPTGGEGSAVGELAFEREDWTAFRTVEGLQRRAGTSMQQLAAVVVKELVDNALDAAGDCELELSEGVIAVGDDGEGIPGDDEQLAHIFSMNRPQISSKYLRLPTRGALGNGLRVVVGAVAATGGKLFVTTRGRTVQILPDCMTGRSEAVRVDDHGDQEGTRIEVMLGPPFEPDDGDLWMGECAIVAARARKYYQGNTSPHWYDTEAFHELLMSVLDTTTTVRDLISRFDGCSRKAGDIAAEFAGVPAKSLSRDEAAQLLHTAQDATSPVNPSRLGETLPHAFPGQFARKKHHVMLSRGTNGDRITIPVVVETWADIDPNHEDSDLFVLINGSPCITEAFAQHFRKDKVTIFHGGGLDFSVKTGAHRVVFYLNIITPYMPVTSDGKSPALGMFTTCIQPVVARAWRLAKAARPRSEKINVKSVVFAHMEEGIVASSGDRKYRFNWRQVYYQVRPHVMEEAGSPLNWNYFSQTLVREYLEEHGDEPMAYRDSRGTFYMPHKHDSFPLGTLEVEQFSRPEYVFNKVLVIEKEGFFEALKAEGWPERHDCALLTSKGQPTDAARDLIDLIGANEEPVTVFMIHDCDCAGTIIFQSFQEETKARPRRNLEIVNLGLDVDEARQLQEDGSVEIESVTYEAAQPVARYVDAGKEEWLQTNRVELNAMTTPQFIEWLDGKMQSYVEEDARKLIPPDDHMATHIENTLRDALRDQITERILAEAKIDDQVEAAMTDLEKDVNELVPTLANLVRESFEENESRRWTYAVETAAEELLPSTEAES